MKIEALSLLFLLLAFGRNESPDLTFGSGKLRNERIMLMLSRLPPTAGLGEIGRDLVEPARQRHALRDLLGEPFLALGERVGQRFGIGVFRRRPDHLPCPARQ